MTTTIVTGVNYFRALTLCDIVDILGDEEGQAIDHIYIEPPEVTYLSDEDEAEEDTGGFIDDLPGNQLRAPAEAFTVNRENVLGDNVTIL